MEKYYLIDYENVGCDGLCGCDRLGVSDHIVIFFTNNAKKIDMREIANHGEAELIMIEVPAGKQSTDIHIGSYLGYLIGTGRECDVGIVSNDTDFDNVIKFWAKTGAGVSRSRSITIAAVKHKAADKSKAEKPQEKRSAAKETDRENNRSKAPAQKAAKAENPKPQVKKTEKKGSKVPVNRKKSAEKPTAKKKTEKPEAKLSESKSELNNSVIQTLGKAGFDNETSGAVASLAVKSLGKEGGKQQVYRALVAKYGQEKGLSVYNHIRKKL